MIELDFEKAIDELLYGLDRKSAEVKRACNRTNSKMLVWLNREVKKIFAKTIGIAQKTIIDNKRISKYKRHGKGGGVWVGLNPLKAHWIGAKKLKSGVKAGKQIYNKAFYWPQYNIFLERQSNGKLDVLKIDVKDDVLPRLKRIKAPALKRFRTILEQELNYEFNVRGQQ